MEASELLYWLDEASAFEEARAAAMKEQMG